MFNLLQKHEEWVLGRVKLKTSTPNPKSGEINKSDHTLKSTDVLFLGYLSV